MLLHLTWKWSRAVQEGCRWFHWSNKKQRFCEWMGTSIPWVLDISKRYSIITKSLLEETDATTLNKELWSKNMKEYYEAVKQVFDVLMKETIHTKRLGKSSYIISFQTKLYPAINQIAYCLFGGMGTKITWDFVKSISRKRKRILMTL